MSMPHLKRIEESADSNFNRGSALVLDQWTNRSLFLFSSDSHYFQQSFFLRERKRERKVAWMHGTFPEWDHCFLCVCGKLSQVRGQVLPGCSPWQSTCACFLIFPCRGQRRGERWKPKQRSEWCRWLVWTLVWVCVWGCVSETAAIAPACEFPCEPRPLASKPLWQQTGHVRCPVSLTTQECLV